MRCRTVALQEEFPCCENCPLKFFAVLSDAFHRVERDAQDELALWSLLKRPLLQGGCQSYWPRPWIPAFAGMTSVVSWHRRSQIPRVRGNDEFLVINPLAVRPLHLRGDGVCLCRRPWIPAFAGMTSVVSWHRRSQIPRVRGNDEVLVIDPLAVRPLHLRGRRCTPTSSAVDSRVRGNDECRTANITLITILNKQRAPISRGSLTFWNCALRSLRRAVGWVGCWTPYVGRENWCWLVPRALRYDDAERLV